MAPRRSHAFFRLLGLALWNAVCHDQGSSALMGL